VTANFILVAHATERKTAAERREEILDAALTEFAQHGYEATSADVIARRAGISQPYLFRLFGTKKELVLASTERCLDDTLREFQEASRGRAGADALAAMGQASTRWIAEDARRLRGQMQAYAACDDPDVCAVVRRGFARLVEHVESTGASPAEVSTFFARGMLCNVLSMMGVPAGEGWDRRLLEGLEAES
jgi:AcrR family transcriptional regulator